MHEDHIKLGFKQKKPKKPVYLRNDFYLDLLSQAVHINLDGVHFSLFFKKNVLVFCSIHMP